MKRCYEKKTRVDRYDYDYDYETIQKENKEKKVKKARRNMLVLHNLSCKNAYSAND